MTRIIAGIAGGRRLATPRHDRTRPTTDRVREAVFSAITAFYGRGAAPPETSLDGIAFLDLYAGSGAVGLEAASRGASPVLLVEKDRRTAAMTRHNSATTGVGGTVRAEPVAKVLAERPAEPFRVVWLDPPYDMPTAQLEEVATTLVERGWLTADPLVIAERSSRSAPISWPGQLPSHWERRYGETTLYFAAQED